MSGRRKCPINCPCICHDTGGSGHDHEGAPCPGKTPEGRARLRRERADYAARFYDGETANRGRRWASPYPEIQRILDRHQRDVDLTAGVHPVSRGLSLSSAASILRDDYLPKVREQLNNHFLIVDSLTDVQDRIIKDATLKYHYGAVKISPQVVNYMRTDARLTELIADRYGVVHYPEESGHYGNTAPLPTVTPCKPKWATGPYYPGAQPMSTRPTTASALRKQLKAIEKQIEALDKFGEDDHPDETVIFYKTNFGRVDYRGHDAQSYTYTALKVNGAWYLTGKTTGPVSWDVLVDRHLQFATEVWVADSWTAL